MAGAVLGVSRKGSGAPGRRGPRLGAVLGASRKGSGAPGRRGPRLLSAWQAQYLEHLERVAARLVAVAAAPVCVAGAILGASRQSPWACVAQYLEPPERVAARLVAVGRGSVCMAAGAVVQWYCRWLSGRRLTTSRGSTSPWSRARVVTW